MHRGDTRHSSTFRHRAKPWLQVAALLLAVIGCASAQAEIYKWTDSKGGVHYSEQPPAAGVKFEKISPRYGAPATPAAAQPKSDPQNDQKQAELDKQKQDIQRKEEVARIRMQNCEVAQRRLIEFESRPRILVTNPDGTAQRLTEEERQAKIADAQNLISKYCD